MATQVDFYILKQGTLTQRDLTACRLVDKAFHLEHQIHIHAQDQQQAQHFDELLWTFHDKSFLPHTLYQPDSENPPPISIGYQNQIPAHGDVLINLSDQTPAFTEQFSRVVEFVYDDEPQRQLARQRFKHYRDAGCEVNTHDIN
jgi:DNA polymerase-3 subunit chi